MKSPFHKPFGSRSPFGSQSGGGGGVAAPVLTLVYDGLGEDPPIFLFDCDIVADGYLELHSTATPPGIGNGDVGSESLGTLVAGENNIGTIDLSAYSGETFYLHIYAQTAGGTDVITSQEITMPLVDVNPFFYPTPVAGAGTFGLTNEASLTSAGHYMAYIMTATEAMAITHIGFSPVTVSGTCTAVVSIEGVASADGIPNGLDPGGGAVVTGTSGTLVNNTWALTALGSTVNISAGQTFAIKIAYNAGTSIQVARLSLSAWSVCGHPYKVTNTGTPTKADVAGTPVLALGSSSTTFYKLPWAVPYENSGSSANAFNSGSSPNVRGVRFQLPFNTRISGIRHIPQNNAGDFSMVLYDDAGAELSSSSTVIDATLGTVSTSATNNWFFDNKVSITKNTWYRLAFIPSSVTNMAVPYFGLPSTDYASANPWGTTWYHTTYNGSTWSDTTTAIPALSLILDQL